MVTVPIYYKANPAITYHSDMKDRPYQYVYLYFSYLKGIITGL